MNLKVIVGLMAFVLAIFLWGIIGRDGRNRLEASEPPARPGLSAITPGHSKDAARERTLDEVRPRWQKMIDDFDVNKTATVDEYRLLVVIP